MSRTLIKTCDEEGCNAYTLSNPPDWQHYFEMESDGRTFLVRAAPQDYCPQHVRPEP